jgi:cation diffusion facilitator CzcD-associated flavoprotein CzcO
LASKWLIIGGGIHGTHLSLHLMRRGGVSPERIRVLDPYPAPLAVWDRVTRAVGMAYLRSPIVHNLHWDQGSLGLFARLNQQAPMTRFIPPFGRPSLELFNAHAAHLIRKFGLDQLRIQRRAESIQRTGSGWRVETSDGALDADRVVLAIGLSEQPYWPEWAQAHRTDSRVQHIFAPDFDRETLPDWEQAVVVGGGITAAQVALALAARNPGTVTLVRRHDERVFDFDSDVGWMNAINLRGFEQISDQGERRRVIRQARHRGSMPRDVASALSAAVQSGAIRVSESGAESLSEDKSTLCLTLSNGEILPADQIILATGYIQTRPGGAMIDRLIGEYELATAACGYPIVSQSLEWTQGLHVSGPLAELEVGPAARNIIGARMAGQRLIEV